MPRDDFSQSVKKTVAERAGYLCSIPRCNRPTIGPHSNPNKAKCLGVAAHICAAAPGGPRYDPDQTPEERKDIANAIWVCEMHGSDIDKDDSPYPKEILIEWKRIHESFFSTIVNLGLREALGLPGAAHAEQHVAARLLSCLADRRILYELYDKEVPHYSQGPVDIIRNRLSELRANARDYPQIEERIAAMLKACHIFMDEAGPLESRRRLAEEQDMLMVQRFVAALAALRKTFGLLVKQIAVIYGLSIDKDLASIVPSDDA